MGSGRIDLTSFAGLVTAPGMLERNPASCVDVVNWEFPAPGVIRKRRGQARQVGNTGGPVWKLLTSRLMGNNVLAHVGTGTSGTQLRYGDGSGALTALTVVDGDSLERQRETRMQGAVCQRNHYVTSDVGVARVESTMTTAAYAGMPRGQGPSVNPSLVSGSSLADGFARAYRVTWHRQDADGVELGGAPSSRWVVANRSYTSGYIGSAMGARCRFLVPHEFGTLSTALTTSYYWRLWGTRSYDEANGQLGDDEMFLVSEAYLTAPDIASGVVTYDDSTPDSFLLSSPRLHTNLYNFPPGEEGMRQGVVNEDGPPPIANDVAYWQDCMWYADTEWRPRFTAALISNLANNDTVTLVVDAGVLVLTAKTVPAGVDDFRIVTAAPTTAINIRETTAAMCAAICARAKAYGYGITAHTTATGGTLPGLFFVEASKPQPNGMGFASSVASKFQFFDGMSTAINAPTGAATNGLVFSKPLRADAVPPINVLTAGPADSRILRIVPFRDRLLVFTDYGIFQVTGRTFADFSVFPLDLGYRLMGRDLVAACDEKVYAWCFEGIVEIDDGGVTVVSAPIEPTIESALLAIGSPAPSQGYSLFAALGYATAYRNQHQVRFHFPEADDSSSLNGCYAWLAFDTRTRAWTKGAFTKINSDDYFDNRSCAVVRFGDDLICYGNWSNGGDTRLFLERRAYTGADFSDDSNEGVAQPVESSLSLQFQLPEQSGAQHWQQTLVNWDASEQWWRTRPTTVGIGHTTEETGVSQSVAVTSNQTRCEPTVSTRRGQRLSVSVTHSLSEYAGIVGVSQSYRSGTRFARKVTP